jgi:hypothetical protein
MPKVTTHIAASMRELRTRGRPYACATFPNPEHSLDAGALTRRARDHYGPLRTALEAAVCLRVPICLRTFMSD